MLPLNQLYTLGSEGGPLLARFAMAVKKIVFTVADGEAVGQAWGIAQIVARDRKYQFLASQVIDYASAQTTALSEKGNDLTDAEIEAIVAAYLPKVVRLIA